MRRLVGASIAEPNGRFPCFGDRGGLQAELVGGNFAELCADVFPRTNL